MAFYELHSEASRRRFAGGIFARSGRQEGAVGPLQESNGQKAGRSTPCHKEAARG